MDERALGAWAEHRPGQHHPVDTVCVAPWVSMEFDPSGWVYTCCASQLYPLGRIGEQRLDELWGGHRARVLRESLQRSDLTVACGTCRWHLEHERMDPVAAVYDRLPVGSPDPQWPHMMLFALSNRCNLGCVMCTPELSSTLRSGAGLEPLESPYGDSFFDDLTPFLEHLRLVKFTGGEPFLAPEHKRIWDLLAEVGAAPRMHITTNGTVWTDTVEKVLAGFDVDISISVDAASAGTYAAVRRGGDFDALMVNIDRFEAATLARGTSLHVSFCLLDQNAHELADFLCWAERFATPASINLVVDGGLALHDREVERLEEVRRSWEADERRLGDRLRTNRTTWDTQRAQLDAVIAERRRGIPPPPRRAMAVERSMFSVPRHPRDDGDRTVDRGAIADDATRRLEDEVHRLRRWSCGGDVAILVVDRIGLVSEVRCENPRLGIERGSLVGRSIEDLPSCIEAADGRRAWIVDMDQVGDATIRTLALAADAPVRGSTGLAVRTVQIPADDGWYLLLAEDSIYEARDEGESPVTPGAGGTLQVQMNAGRDRPYPAKRAVDLVVLCVVALPALVLGMICAAGIKATSPGPVFFRQERVGMGGRPFTVWKFRSMVQGDNPLFPDDSRITTVGRWLRRLSLDELPQLINVANGTMSIVGPRPTLAYQVERYDDHQRRRLAVRPGLTGLAQINGRNALSWADRIDFDVEYVESQSVREDLRIITRTFTTMLSGEGVEGHPTDDPLAVPDPDGLTQGEPPEGTGTDRAHGPDRS